MQHDIQQTTCSLRDAGYIADAGLATTLTLSQKLRRPVLLEGEAGVGKTAVAQALASVANTQLIRLQCFEGIDIASAAYEWNYARQLLTIKRFETNEETLAEEDIYNAGYLLERPLLKAIRQHKAPVLLIDEVDRADEAFEAFLLEVLSEFTISIPEFGTITALSVPQVILTSNATRDLSDALRRRCLYHYIDYPDIEKEVHILRAHLPGFEVDLLKQIAAFVHRLRNEDLIKRPGIAESLDWARALCGFDIISLRSNPDIVNATLGCLLKTRDDQQIVGEAKIDELLLGDG